MSYQTKNFIFLLLILCSVNFKHISASAIEEKPIVVVIPSYNNKNWYKKNLDSVFSQKYNNYRVIYINDASTDNTGKLVAKYIKDNKVESRITLINNPKNLGVMANHYKAIHLCKPNEIIVDIDGDDWLKHDNVLQRVNSAYQDSNVWLTYGQYELILLQQEGGRATIVTQPGNSKEMPPNLVRAHAYREGEWVSSHLRTYYAGLAQHIKLKDLLENGTFYTVSCDVAMMLPMLEMATRKFKFIDEILYVYNCMTPLNIFKTKLKNQIHTNHFIRSKEKYLPLSTPFRNIPKNATADLIIVSENNPEQLYSFIESIYCYMEPISKIYVLYKTQKSKTAHIYEQIKENFKSIDIIPFSLDKNNFKEKLEETIKSTGNQHIILATDNLIIKNFINISNCINAMEQTYAYGFYLTLGKNIKNNNLLTRNQYTPTNVKIKNDIHAWQFQLGEQDWRKPNNFSMTIYRKNDIIRRIKDINYNSYKSLESTWNNQIFDINQVGLFFKNSKVLQLTTNNKKKLIHFFKNGMKINIAPLFLIHNSEINVNIDLEFETRNKQSATAEKM